MKKETLIIYFAMLFTVSAYTQTVNWKAAFNSFTDNREYTKEYHYPQTMFGARLKTGGEVNFEQQYCLYAGIDYLYEFGANNRNTENIDYTLFFKFENNHLRFLSGAFPRKGLLHYPIAMLTDTLLYYKPNMEGLFLEAFGKAGNQNIWIDWTGRQADFVRETFMAGTSGKLNFGNVFIENYVLLYHHALQKIRLTEQHIHDYMGYDAGVGYNFSSLLSIDSLSLSAHMLKSLYRNRGDGIIHKPAGAILELFIKHKFVGSKLTYYSGKKQYFYWGDAFYKNNNYARWDIDLIPFKKSKFIDCTFRWSLHFIKGELDNSQQLFLKVDLDKLHFDKP